jgi:Fe-S cluster assembly protein SufD
MCSLGGQLVRNELNVGLLHEGAKANLNGLFAVSGEQHVDNKTFIDHAVAHCKSEELYKGILDERSHGVFNGEVLVRENAQKTDARQASKNLLLSENAQIDTKPQLMIYADDVKCSHGATIGQLDSNSVFYLQSRGIDEKTARQILTRAFASEMIEKIENEKVKEVFDRVLQSWFNHQTLH